MKKLAKLTTLSLVAGLASSVAMAQENIGLINVAYLFSHHPDREASFEKLQEGAKAPAEKLKEEEKKLAETKAKFEKEVEDKLKSLEKDAPKLKAADIKQRQSDIEKFAQKREGELKTLVTAFQEKVMAFESENQQSAMNLNQRLLKDIETATQKVAKEKAYTLVLDEKAAVFAAEGKDITQDVLKALEATKKAK